MRNYDKIRTKGERHQLELHPGSDYLAELLKEPTPFTTLALQSAEALHELKRLEVPAPLTIEALRKEALTLAEADDRRMAEVERVLQLRAKDATASRHFVSEFSRMVRDGRFGEFRRDQVLRYLRIYGGAGDALGEILHLEISAAELVCLGVLTALKRWPSKFEGTCENRKQHLTDLEKARARFADLCAKLKSSWTLAEDVVLASVELYDSAAGKARVVAAVTLKLCPTISIAEDRWPIALSEFLLARSGVGDAKLIAQHDKTSIAAATATTVAMAAGGRIVGRRPRRKVLRAKTALNAESTNEEASA